MTSAARQGIVLIIAMLPVEVKVAASQMWRYHFFGDNEFRDEAHAVCYQPAPGQDTIA